MGLRTRLAVWSGACLLQTLAFAAVVNGVPSPQVVLFLMSFGTLLVCGVPVLYAYWKCAGYLDEARTSGMKHTVWKLGFCNAAGRLMQTIGATETSAALQLSLIHAIIPVTVTFLLTTTGRTSNKFSFRGIALGAAIFIGCTLHAAVLYMNGPASEGAETLFWNTVYLLAAVPLSLSAVLQQQALCIRRINPLSFVFSVLAVDALLQAVVIFANCFLRDYSTVGWGPLKAMLIDFSNSFRVVRAWHPFLILVISCPVAQIGQILAVRKSGFKACTAVITALPVVAGFLVALGTVTPFRQILGIFVGSQLVDGIVLDRWELRAISFMFNAFLAALAWRFRIQQLSGAYMLPRCEKPADDSMQLYLPFLDVARQQSVAERLTSAATELNMSMEEKRGLRYVPESLPGGQLMQPMPVVDRPALLNPLGGCVLNEYTDWKRLHDFITLPTPEAELLFQRTIQNTAETAEIRERLGARLPQLQEKVRRSNCAAQYTRRHIALIYAAQATATRLAAASRADSAI